jgi:hypothetical protein
VQAISSLTVLLKVFFAYNEAQQYEEKNWLRKHWLKVFFAYNEAQQYEEKNWLRKHWLRLGSGNLKTIAFPVTPVFYFQARTFIIEMNRLSSKGPIYTFRGTKLTLFVSFNPCF